MGEISTASKDQVSLCVYLFGSRIKSADEFREWPIGKAFLDSGFVPSAGDDYDVVWCFDLTWKALSHLVRVPRSHRVLFVLEPRSVIPAQHRRFVQGFFGHVFVFSHDQRNEHTHFIRGGGAFNTHRQACSQEPDFDVVLANANKSSAVRGSLYHLRTSVLVAASKSGLTVGLAGSGWKTPGVAGKQIIASVVAALAALEIPTIRLEQIRQTRILRALDNLTLVGNVSSLGDFYASGRVALVIENDPDFLSEKLFNAMAAAPAVVYVGTQEARAYSMPGIHFANPDVDSVVKALWGALSGPKINPASADKVLRLRSQDVFASRLVSRVTSLCTISSGNT